MPKDVTSGQVIWYERTVGSLIGRAETFNIRAGVSSSFSCPGPCPCAPVFASAYLTPEFPQTITFGTQVNFSAYEIDRDSCQSSSNYYGPFPVNGVSWSSNNTSIATVSPTVSSTTSATGVGVGSCRIYGSYNTIVAYANYPNPCTPISSNVNAYQDLTVTPRVTVTGAELCADAIPLTLEPSSASGSFTLTLVSSAGSVDIVNESRNGGNYRDSFKLGTLPTRAFTSIQATWVSNGQTGTGSRSYSFTVLGDYLTTCYVTELESDYSGSTFTAGTATSSCEWSSRSFFTGFLDKLNLNGSGIDSSNTALQLEFTCTGAPPTSPPYGGWRYRRPTTITTSCGNQPSVGTTIASPTLACGTLVRIDGLGCRRKQDTGGGLSSTQIDVYNGIGHSSCAGWSNIQRRVARID